MSEVQLSDCRAYAHRSTWRALLLPVPCLLVGCGILGIGDGYDYPDGKVLFTSPPMDLAGASWFEGIGSPGPLPRDHGGFHLADPFTLPATVPVLAVANGVIKVARHGYRTMLDHPDPMMRDTRYDEYAFLLKISTTIRYQYGHISRAHPSVLAQMPDLGDDERFIDTDVVVEAGDTLGWVGPHPALDMGILDDDVELDFLNPDRYGENMLKAGYPFDYFGEPLLSEILAITTRQEEPRGGKIDWDIDGRIIGNWFLEGTTSFEQWSRQFCIVYDHIYGDRVTISDGSPLLDGPGSGNLGRGADLWWVKGNIPRPETIGVAQGMVKYEVVFRDLSLPPDQLPVQGVVLVQLVEQQRLRVETFRDMTASEVGGFTANARVYVR